MNAWSPLYIPFMITKYTIYTLVLYGCRLRNMCTYTGKKKKKYRKKGYIWSWFGGGTACVFSFCVCNCGLIIAKDPTQDTNKDTKCISIAPCVSACAISVHWAHTPHTHHTQSTRTRLIQLAIVAARSPVAS